MLMVCVGGFADGQRLDVRTAKRGDAIILCEPAPLAVREWSFEVEDEAGRRLDRVVYIVRRITWHDTRHGDVDIAFLAPVELSDGQAVEHMVKNYCLRVETPPLPQ